MLWLLGLGMFSTVVWVAIHNFDLPPDKVFNSVY